MSSPAALHLEPSVAAGWASEESRRFASSARSPRCYSRGRPDIGGGGSVRPGGGSTGDGAGADGSTSAGGGPGGSEDERDVSIVICSVCLSFLEIALELGIFEPGREQRVSLRWAVEAPNAREHSEESDRRKREEVNGAKHAGMGSIGTGGLGQVAHGGLIIAGSGIASSHRR